MEPPIINNEGSSTPGLASGTANVAANEKRRDGPLPPPEEEEEDEEANRGYCSAQVLAATSYIQMSLNCCNDFTSVPAIPPKTYNLLSWATDTCSLRAGGLTDVDGVTKVHDPDKCCRVPVSVKSNWYNAFSSFKATLPVSAEEPPNTSKEHVPSSLSLIVDMEWYTRVGPDTACVVVALDMTGNHT